MERTPEHVFLRAEGRRWSYADAWQEARRFAGFLDGRGEGGPGHRVASFLANCPEALWTWFGTQLTGATYVSLNREHRGRILQDMLSRSRATTLVTESSALELLPPAGTTSVERILLTDRPGDDLPSQADQLGCDIRGYDVVYGADPVDGCTPDPADVGTIMFTSGTTGRSKAVLIPHNQFCRGAAHLVEALTLTDRDVYHGWMPLYHVGGQLHMTMTTVVAGASLGLVPRLSASAFWTQVHELGATIFGGFTNVLRILWAMPEREDDHDCPLRLGICATIPAEIHRPFERRFGVRLVDTYGMTEAEPLTIPVAGEECPLGSCGKAGPDFEVVALDDLDREPPVGEVGEIAARPLVPDVIMHGYEGDEAATAEAWRSGWFHTGDVGRLDESGYVYWIDRKKHTIRRRGENISSWELEQILSAHPDVAQCAVVGVPSPLGEEDVKALIVPKEGAAPDASEIHAFCADRMARFMVPRYIEIRSALPRSEIGKVQKELLRGMSPQTWDAESGRNGAST